MLNSSSLGAALHADNSEKYFKWSSYTSAHSVFYVMYNFLCGPRSSVGIATDYGLGGPGIEYRWGEIFRTCPDGPGAHPASCTMGTGSFPGVECCQGVMLTLHPLLVMRFKNRVELYLYSP